MRRQTTHTILWCLCFMAAGLSGGSRTATAQSEEVPAVNVLKRMRSRNLMTVGMESKAPPMNFIMP